MSPHSIEKLGHNLPASGLVAASQAAVGFGAGLLVSRYMDTNLRNKLAVGLLTAGTAILLPVLAGVITRVTNRPTSTRRVRKQLESIRQDSGFTEEDAEIV